MSETIAQSQSDTYAKSVGTSAVVLVKGGGNGQAGSGIVTVGGTINVPRSVVVHNAHASQVLYVGWGSDVTSSSGFPIAAGGYMEFDLLYTDELWGVGSGAATDARIFVLHGKGVPPFSPSDLSPTLWLDASDTSTISDTAGAVDTWSDKSGNGYDLTQATAAYKPKTGTATINSLNVLEFDTANGQQHLKNATFPLIGNDYDMFIVLQVNPADLDYVLFSSGNKNGVVGRALSGSASTAIASDTTYSSLHVDSALFTGTTVGQLWTATATGSPIVVRGTQLSGGTYDGFSVSRVATDPGFSDGTVVCEVIVANYPLTAQQISDTETYLAAKWGITI